MSYITSGTPAGSSGCYDFFHSHPSVCIGTGGVITLTEPGSPYWYSESQCRARGFRVLKLPGDRMLHLWIGPDYTKVPIFGHDNRYLYNGYYRSGAPDRGDMKRQAARAGSVAVKLDGR